MILPLKTKNTFSTNRLLKSTLNVQASSHSLAVSRSPAAGEIRRRGDSQLRNPTVEKTAAILYRLMIDILKRMF